MVMSRWVLSVGCLYLAVAQLAVAASAEREDAFAIRNGDRVVIYGDSITAGVEYQGYPRYIEAYVRTRHPAWTTRIWNRGWSGDTAANLARFERDCLALEPDVILFNMGMNDAGYTPEIAPRLRAFSDNVARAVSLARDTNPQVRMVLISPILYETRAPGATRFYPYVLRSYAREERELARRLGVRFIDLNRKYGETMGLAECLFPGSIVFSGDGIHPLPDGGNLFIAAHILEGLGAGGDLASVHIDGAAGTLASAEGATVELIASEGGALTFERTLHALPFPVVDATSGVTYRDRAVAGLIEVAEDLNRDELRISGLPATAYALSIDGKTVAELSADELADGVNLSRFFQTPDQAQAVAVSEAVGRKQIAQSRVWHLGLKPGDNAAALTSLSNDLREAEAALRTISQPSARRFALAPLDREVDRYRRREQLLRVTGPRTLAFSEAGVLTQTVSVVVNNLSLLARHVECTWDASGVTPATRLDTFAPGEEKELSFRFDLRAGDATPRLTLKHQPVDLSFPPLAQQYAPTIVPRMNVPRASGPIAVDGRLDEWPATPQIDFEPLLTPNMRRHRAGPGDFSAAAHVAWTEAALAVGIAVADQDHVNHFTDARIGWDDAATVQVAGKSYTLALTGRGPAILPEDAAADGILFAVRRQELQTVYELTVPARVLGGEGLKADARLLFGIAVTDRDRDESHKEVDWCGSLARPRPAGSIHLVDHVTPEGDGSPLRPAN